MKGFEMNQAVSRKSLFAALVLMVALFAGAFLIPAQSAFAADGWTLSDGKYYYKKDGVKLTGKKTIGDHTYYFDSKGVQRTGWRYIGGKYYFFKIANKGDGYMVKNTIKNGIKLQSDGSARISNTANKKEARLMYQANKVMDSLCKPTTAKSTKLRAAFNYLKGPKITERVYHPWSSAKGWHRKFADEIFDYKAGDCVSMGCAMAYLANAIGYSKCQCVASGGHGWARVNGLVYDPEWSRHKPRDYYAVDGKYADMNYKDNSRYVVTLTRTTLWTGTALSTSDSKYNAGKNGLYYEDGVYRYYSYGKMLTSCWKTYNSHKYHFKSNGAADVKSTKIGDYYYVFNMKGQLLTGTSTRAVTVDGNEYQVSKYGKAVSGFNADHTKYYKVNGRLAKNVFLSKDGKYPHVSSSTGLWSKEKTDALRAARDTMTANGVGQDAKEFLKLMNQYDTCSDTYKAESCNEMENGAGIDALGTDCIYTFTNVKVYTFITDDEAYEYLIAVDPR